MDKIRKIWNIITTALLSLVILLAILLVGVRIFGLMPYTVLSGSMEPTYHVGSVVYVKKVDPADLKEEDVITFVIDSGTVVTHKIIQVIPDENDPNVIRFQTKGEANETPDGTPVHCNNVIGKVVFSLPLLGYLAHFVQNPPGNILSARYLR